MSPTHPTPAIQAVRRFSRFYTRRIGALHEGLLGGPLSLAEGRVIYEIAQAGETTAAQLVNDLALDPGYLSRMLRALQDRGLVARRPSATDGRQSVLSLTPDGQTAFGAINDRSQAEVGAMVAPLAGAQQHQLIQALATAEALLGGAAPGPIVLRPHRPGDMGWVVHRHGALYAQEYGWDGQFEALVADIVAQFAKSLDPARERCWIAERDGAVMGSVFLVDGGEGAAKLRLLYVEPEARGSGLGRRLVAECVGFARAAGYRRVTLWTNDVLAAARRIYQQAGFQLVDEAPHHSFGHDLVGQSWRLEL